MHFKSVVGALCLLGFVLLFGSESPGQPAPKGTRTAVTPVPKTKVLTPAQVAAAKLQAAFTALHSPAPMAPDTLRIPTPNSVKFVWAAMGDSYAAGEGNPEHGKDKDDIEDFSGVSWGHDRSMWIPFPGVSSYLSDIVTCHRSDESGAAKAHRRLQAEFPDVTFVFGCVACSGAGTRDLYTPGYLGPTTRKESWLGRNGDIPQPAQIDRVREFMKINAGQLDAVYMSIGGNDFGFGDLAGGCFARPWIPFWGGCEQWVEKGYSYRVAYLKSQYGILRAHLSELGNVPVFISQYPNPMNDQQGIPPVCVGDDYDEHGDIAFGFGKDAFMKDHLTNGEAVSLFAATDSMNSAIAAVASGYGWKIIAAPYGNVTNQGHGMCTDDPFVNLNSKALRNQGHDLEGTGPFILSNGMIHPNNAGYEAYADVIVAALRKSVEAKMREGLKPPINLRISSAQKGEWITLRWDDMATDENAYEVEITGPTFTTNPGLVTSFPFKVVTQRVTGKNVQEFFHNTVGVGGVFKYRVRACNTGTANSSQCGEYSAQITGANISPSLPLELKAIPFTVFGTNALIASVSWNAGDPNKNATMEYVLRLSDGRQFRTSQTELEISPRPPSTVTYSIAACNRVGCTNFSDPAIGLTAP